VSDDNWNQVKQIFNSVLELDPSNPEHRKITVNSSPEDQVLAVHENLNPGWKASLDGQALTSVRIDGWQQGWIVPAGSGGVVDLKFTPGFGYRLALIAGLLMVAVMALFALPQRRRRGTLARRTSVARFDALPEAGSAAALEAHASTGGPLRGVPGGRWRSWHAAYGVLAALAVVAIGGWWGLGALVVVIVWVRQRLQMRNILAAACVLAGVTAAMSINADEDTVFAKVSIGAALIVVACMAIRLDAAVNGPLTRLTSKPPPRR